MNTMLSFKTIAVLLALIALGVSAASIPGLKAEKSNVTVSGISAGGAMAIQLAVAHSADVIGVGSIAGPPYYCAQGGLSSALLSCMYATMPVPLSAMQSYLESAASAGTVDPLSNLAEQKVWLYTGTMDTVVKSSVVKSGAQFYQQYSHEVVLTDDIPSEHAWITNNYGSSCSYLGSPYINNCNLDAAGTIFKQSYGSSHVKAPASDASSMGTIISFGQDEYTPSGSASSISMGPTGYAYVPNACNGTAGCRVHVALHGCTMDIDTIGMAFVEHAYINEWAATNHIIVLYPQVQKSTLFPSNPEACFDWWGYTTADYANKNGPQVATIWNMVKALMN